VLLIAPNIHKKMPSSPSLVVYGEPIAHKMSK
jgi:hypothetical protein